MKIIGRGAQEAAALGVRDDCGLWSPGDTGSFCRCIARTHVFDENGKSHLRGQGSAVGGDGPATKSKVSH